MDNRRRMLLSVGGNPFPEYTYTGNSEFIDDGDGNWRIKFLTSGNFTLLNKNFDVDIFLVGGGGSGTFGGPNGGGGGGGYTKTVKNVTLSKAQNYPVTIGAGGLYTGNTNAMKSGSPSSFASYKAQGGEYGYISSDRGGNGGSGGGGSYGGAGGSDGSSGNRGTMRPGGSGQGTTTREFGEATGTLYGGGGGAGGAGYGASSHAGGRADSSAGIGGAGGSKGDGDGGYGRNGVTNRGGGGGQGGEGYYSSSSDGGGGNGGSGIVIIRNARG